MWTIKDAGMRLCTDAHLLIVQVAPVHPEAHSHVNCDPGASWHVPPFWHGAGAHGLSTTSQFIPENPSGHVHKN